MINIFKIFKSDLKSILKNKVLLIIILGLCFLPSLYAWFNIKASWDPYGNTKNISVAVINSDEGHILKDKNLNIGNELIEKLKTNNNLGWVFTDKNSALTGVKKGDYYACIEIPKDFTKNLTSLISKDIKKGEIIYTVNEKINAIAPKITDKGASTIQNEVNQTVVKIVSDVIFETFNEIGIEIENQLPRLVNLENELIQVQNKFKDVDKTISLASDTSKKVSDIVKDLEDDIPLIKDTIVSSNNLASDLKTFLQDTKGSLNDISPIIKNDLQLIVNISSNVSKNISNLINAIDNNLENAPELIDNLHIKLSNLYNSSNNLLELLIKLDKFNPSHPLQEPIKQLQNVVSKLEASIDTLTNLKDKISSGEKPSLEGLNNVLQVSNDINNILSKILANFDSQISQPVNNLFSDSFKVTDNVISVLNNAKDKLPAVEDMLNTTLDFSNNANDSIKFMQQKLPIAKSVVDELVNAIKAVNDSEDMTELVNLLKSDVFNRSDFLKQPVDIVTDKLYPISNYGSAMTPFYTVLSLWVGILLLMSILSTEVYGDYKSYEIYFGRGLTFVSIAIIQSAIVSIGNILLLKVDLLHPYLFIALSIFISIVFTSIVYSLVSLFGNVGKAICVILLVIQVAASGGTFPIEVTPDFFQVVNPFLPFTYAISALRECIGGIYMPNLRKDLYLCLIFMLIPIIFTAFFKNTVNKYTSKFKSKLHESDLIGH